MTRVLLQPLNLAYKASKVQSIPSNQPRGNSKPSISLHMNQTSTRVQTYHLPDHVSGHQDSPRDMKKTKPIMLAPKKHISSISYMRAMSVCAPCRYARNATKNKETQEPGQGRDILLVHCTEVCAICLLGRGQFDIALASPCICILGRFFHAAKKMLALKNPHITYPEGQLGKFR